MKSYKQENKEGGEGEEETYSTLYIFIYGHI